MLKHVCDHCDKRFKYDEVEVALYVRVCGTLTKAELHRACSDDYLLRPNVEIYTGGY